MPSKLDPHHLVALMCHKFHGIQDGSARRLDPSFHNFEHGSNNHHTTKVRTFPILDALASICASQSQVYAVALQLDIEGGEVRLAVAGNHSVPKAVLRHLEQVWRRLRVLSSKYAEERARASERIENQLASPEILAQVAHSWKVLIFKDIYQFSLKKQMKRIKKWLEKLGKFVEVLLLVRRESNLNHFERSICNTSLTLSIAMRPIRKLHDHPETPLTDTEWEIAYTQSMKANIEVRALLANTDETGLEVLAEEFKGMPCLPPIT